MEYVIFMDFQFVMDFQTKYPGAVRVWTCLKILTEMGLCLNIPYSIYVLQDVFIHSNPASKKSKKSK